VVVDLQAAGNRRWEFRVRTGVRADDHLIRAWGLLLEGTAVKTIISTVALALFVAQTAGATPAVNQLFMNVDNLVSDNNAEYVIDLAGQPTILELGDLMIGSITFNTVEDLSGVGGTRSIGGGGPVDELVAIFATKVLSVPPAGGFGVFTLGPVTPRDTLRAQSGPDGVVGTADDQMTAGLKAELDSWQPGTIVSVYNDPAPALVDRYTRVFNGAYNVVDDGDPALTGADMGTGPFLTEELLLRSAYNWSALGSATQLMELGFTGPDTDGDGAPNPNGAGEDWQVFGSNNIANLRAINGVGAFANFGVNMLVNNTGLTFQPVATNFGTADMAGSSSLTGLGSARTPFDLFSNTDVIIHPIPEPTALALAAVAFLALGGFIWRRRR